MTDAEKLNLVRSYLITFHNLEMSIDEIRRRVSDRALHTFGTVLLADQIAIGGGYHW